MKRLSFLYWAENLRLKPRRFSDDRAGVAAIEFAFVFPVMLILMFGSFEYTKMVTASQRVSIATNAMVEILAQQPDHTTIDDTQLKLFFDALKPIMAPFNITATNPTMTLSSITFWATAQGATTYNALTDWSKTSASGGTVRPCDVKLAVIANSASPAANAVPVGMVPIPTATNPPAYSTVLVADVAFSYPSPLNIDLGFYKSPPTVTIARTIFNNPRNVNYVPFPVIPNGSNPKIVDTSQYSGTVCNSAYLHAQEQ